MHTPFPDFSHLVATINNLKFGFILDWIVEAMEQKKLLNWLAMSFGLVRNSPLLLRIILGDSDSLVFKEIIDLIPFQVFLKLLMLFLK